MSPLITTPLFADTKGNLYLIPGATPLPPKPVAPVIPTTAKNTGNILIIPNWKMEKDSGTPGSATNINMVVNKDGSALFSADQTGKGGVRWSVHAANNVPDTIMNFCYDITIQFQDPTQQACVEMDINFVTNEATQRTFLLCVQASSYSDSYEYTTLNKGGFGWNKSNIPANPEKWLANTDKHIRIFTHRDATGNVFYDGVEEDTIYVPYSSTCFGQSAKAMNWKPKGMILPNFQLDGANTAGHISALVKNFNISYW